MVLSLSIAWTAVGSSRWQHLKTRELSSHRRKIRPDPPYAISSFAKSGGRNVRVGSTLGILVSAKFSSPRHCGSIEFEKISDDGDFQ